MASYLCLLPELPEEKDTSCDKEMLLELLVSLNSFNLIEFNKFKIVLRSKRQHEFQFFLGVFIMQVIDNDLGLQIKLSLKNNLEFDILG